jgi:CRISPR-associated protein Cas2
MVVMSLTACPAPLRGELTRWLLEIRPLVYVGQVNARIRDLLWDKTCKEIGVGSAVQLWSAPDEQGFRARSWGAPDYVLRDFDGMVLVERPLNTFVRDEDEEEGEGTEVVKGKLK